jgi:hypothetical protein
VIRSLTILTAADLEHLVVQEPVLPSGGRAFRTSTSGSSLVVKASSPAEMLDAIKQLQRLANQWENEQAQAKATASMSIGGES